MANFFLPVANNAITKNTNNFIFILTKTQVNWSTNELRTTNDVCFHSNIPFIIPYETLHVRKSNHQGY